MRMRLPRLCGGLHCLMYRFYGMLDHPNYIFKCAVFPCLLCSPMWSRFLCIALVF